MFDLEPLNNNYNPNEYSSDCLPFEEILDKSLKDIQGKTTEELKKKWFEEDEKRQIKTEDYVEYLESAKSDLLNNCLDDEDDEYSSSEEIPTCNPWRD